MKGNDFMKNQSIVVAALIGLLFLGAMPAQAAEGYYSDTRVNSSCKIVGALAITRLPLYFCTRR